MEICIGKTENNFYIRLIDESGAVIKSAYQLDHTQLSKKLNEFRELLKG